MNKLLSLLIFVTLASLPSYLIRCSSFSFCASPIPFTVLEILILLTVLVWFVSVFKREGNFHNLVNNSWGQIPKNFRLLITFFLGAAVLSIVVSSDKLGALGVFKAYFVEPALLALVVFDYLRRTKNYQLVIFALLFSGALTGAVAIYQKIIGASPQSSLEFERLGRVSAFYNSSNSLALFLVPLFYLGLGFTLENLKNFFTDKKVYLFISLLFLALISVGVFLSGSRGGLVAMGASGLMFIFFAGLKMIKNDFLAIFSKIFVIFLGIVILINAIFLANIDEFSTRRTHDKLEFQISQRLCLWKNSFGLGAQNPILGLGLNEFHLHSVASGCRRDEHLQYPHTLLLNFWLEIGILGLTSFLSLLLLLTYRLLREGNLLSLGVAAAFTSMVIHGFVDVPYFKNDLSVGFWILVALSLYWISHKQEKVIPHQRSH